MSTEKIISFRDLIVWQKSHEFVVNVFLTFSKLGKNNNLRNQIERSSLSVTSNIAEGFGRESKKDKRHFYIMARGSAYEVQSQLYVAFDIGDITKEDFEKLIKLSTISLKLLNGFIGSLKDF